MKNYMLRILAKIFNKLLALSDIDSRIMSAVKVSHEKTFRELSNNIEYQLTLNAVQSTADYIEQYLPDVNPLNNNFEIYDYVLKKIGTINGLFCEFGVYKGSSINYIARNISCKIHGFDSFEGLPEFWRAGYDQGAFKIGQSEFPTFEQNVQLHVGWFEDTLKTFVKTYEQPVAFLHIDCDLYSSTKTVLNYLGNRFREGTIIVFDEYFNYPGWQQHEFKAFQEFVKLHQIRYEYLCYNKYHEQVAVRITHCLSLNNSTGNCEAETSIQPVSN